MSGDFAGATLAQCPSIPVSDTPCTFQITFTPTGTGTRTGAITFTDNAAGSPQTVPLTGTGTSNAGTVTLTPTSLTFAVQALNTTSAPQTVTVKNTGTATVALTGLGSTGPFAIVPADGGGACGTETNLAGGASCTIGVTFTPTAGGAANGVLSVSDNATGSPQTIPLTGTGQSLWSGGDHSACGRFDYGDDVAGRDGVLRIIDYGSGGSDGNGDAGVHFVFAIDYLQRDTGSVVLTGRNRGSSVWSADVL